ncbi:MAG: O-antigen ligase family protein [Chloroflexota bacterium]|nr:O-antigen ligase family protein [Chloroflexota bacterium]
MRREAVAWARARSPAELLALAAGIIVFGYVGWDGALWDARYQFLLHLAAIGAILALVIAAMRADELPRTPLDLPLLGLLAAFALATLGALNLGMSLRALASIVAYAAMLPVAILAVRHRPSWVGLVTSVPILVLSVPVLVTFVGRRLEWVAAGAPGLPPIRLPAETTFFGSVAVPPFLLFPAWALAGLIGPRKLRSAVRIGLVLVGIPLIVLSGSRSAWLAIGAGVAVGVVPWAWRQRNRLRLRGLSGRETLGVAVAVIVATFGLVLVLPRLTAVTSLVYRGALWRDTLAAWNSDPLLGIGPGFMPYARQAATADFSFPVRQPHSHNLALGVLGDAGIVGLAAALVVVGCLVLVAGPWRSRTPVGRSAAVVLVGLGVGGLFEDLTFLPGFNLLVILLVAVALLDAGAVRWAPMRVRSNLRRRAIWAATAACGVVLVGAMVIADAGAVAYRMGTDRAAVGDFGGATTWLTRAVAIDRWHPAGPRALAVTADAAGEPALALRAARRATLLNPGDATAWTNLALLCEADADTRCAIHAAERAAATARYLAPELLNAALLLERLDRTRAADAAYRLSLLTQPATSFVAEWPRSVDIGTGRLPEIDSPSSQLNLLLARHATGAAIDPAEFADPAVRALAQATNGERDAAERWLARAFNEHADDIRAHDINIILRDAWGLPIDDAIRVATVVRGGSFPDRDLGVEVPATVFDVGSFRAYPRDGFVSSAVRLSTTPPFPWTLQELLP